jgi:hypothetical protein
VVNIQDNGTNNTMKRILKTPYTILTYHVHTSVIGFQRLFTREKQLKHLKKNMLEGREYL